MKRILPAFLAILFLMPTNLWAQQGQVVGYYQTWRHGSNPVTTAHLDKMTTLILFQIFPATSGNGSLHTGFWNIPDNALNNLRSHAHARGKKLLVAIGGADGKQGYVYTNAFPSATNNTNRANFVNNIVNFVNEKNLDGVDLDWEFPKNSTEWRQYIDLTRDLKAAMPNKWVSITIGGDSPNSRWGNHFMTTTANAADREYVRQHIWAADAVQIMTYDLHEVPFQTNTGFNENQRYPTHADPAGSEAAMNAWAHWGQGQPGFSKEKLLIGIATYPNQGTRGDNVADIQRKIAFARNNGFGGAIVWELDPGFSQNVGGHNHNNEELWNAIWAANEANGGLTGGGGGTPPTPVRHNIPGNIDASQFSAKSSEVQVEGGNSLGYFLDGRFVEYHINVSAAGQYKITVQTATEQDGRSFALREGNNNNLGTLNAANSGSWTNWVNSEANIILAQGERTLRLTANGAVNIRNISIVSASVDPGPGPGPGPEPDPKPEPSDNPDLADGNYTWDINKDEFGTGSSVTRNVSAGSITFSMQIGTTVSPNYPWASISTYPGGDWSELTSITISYTSNQPLVLTLIDDQGWANGGRGLGVELAAGNHPNRTILLSEFRRVDPADPTWANTLPFNPSDLAHLFGVQLAPKNSEVTASGTVSSLVLNGLIYTEEEPGPDPNPPSSITKNRPAISQIRANVSNGNINLSLPSGAKSVNIALYDVRGRLLFERSVNVGANAASVALPKNIMKNQAAILQVKTNNGVNLAKRVLIR